MADEVTDAPRAQAQIDELTRLLAKYGQIEIQELMARLERAEAALRDEHARLKAALREFGEHYGDCPAETETPVGQCTCGFAAALGASHD